MKTSNMILTKKQQIYQHYRQGKLINMNILQVKKILPFNQNGLIEHAKFTYPYLGEALQNQTKN